MVRSRASEDQQYVLQAFQTLESWICQPANMPRMLDDECFRPSTASKRQTVNTGFKWTMLNEKSILFVYYHPACLRHIFLHTDIPFCGSTSPSPNIFGIVCLFVVKSVRARALATNLLIKHFTAPSAWMFGDVGMCLCFRVMAQTPPDGPQEACKTWKEKDILSVKHNETVPFVCFYLRGDFFFAPAWSYHPICWSLGNH